MEKDALRIALFVPAVTKKTSELALTNPVRAQQFIQESSVLIGRWVMKGTHMQFPKDFFGDPFNGLRADTRAFAIKYSLDPTFKAAMGIPVQ